MLARLVLLSGFFLMACQPIQDTSYPTNDLYPAKCLIITADDYGASENINEGIRLAVENDAITTISVLSNFTKCLPNLKRLSQNNPAIGIGVHLNIITGKPCLEPGKVSSLVRDDGRFYSMSALLDHIYSISVDELKQELRAQILALEKYDIRIDHLSNQCGILSLYDPFFDIIIELAREFEVPIRSPMVASVKYPEVFFNSHMKKRMRRMAFQLALKAPFKAINLMKYCRIHEMEKKIQKLDKQKIIHPDIVIDSFWGEPSASNILYILKHLPNGISELVVHFGNYTREDHYPNGLDVDYFRNRECELLTATSGYLKEYFKYKHIKIIGYSEISEYNIKNNH